MLTLFHDVTDPASAVAVARYSRLAGEGLPIAFEGFEAVGLDIALPPDLNLLTRLDSLGPEAAAEGLTLRRPRIMPPTGLAHVLLAHAEAGPHGPALRSLLYGSYWTDGADIADPAVLCDVAAKAGLDVEEVTHLLADRVALAARRRQMATYRREGIGGVPVVLASRTLVPALMDTDQIRVLARAI
jgi:predicted DsbA family dithiol-disulfide isomerase